MPTAAVHGGFEARHFGLALRRTGRELKSDPAHWDMGERDCRQAGQSSVGVMPW